MPIFQKSPIIRDSAGNVSTGLGTTESLYKSTKVGETTQLAFGDMSNTFTGSDIKCLIIRRNDVTMTKRALSYLNALQQQAEANKNPAADPEAAATNIERFEEGFDAIPNEQIEQYNAEQAIINGNGLADSLNEPNADDTSNLIPLLNLQAITVSTFRAKRQVRALGHISARGMARGTRTCGGTLILTEFNKDVFWKLISGPDPVPGSDYNPGDSGGAVLPDQLVPFDILLLFGNEAGHMAYRMIYEVELVTNGIVYSIQDMYNESTLSFLCSDVSPLIPLPPVVVGDSTFDDATANAAGKPIVIRPLTTVRSGKELARQYRFLKNSRITTR
jgi:hypothetical protein